MGKWRITAKLRTTTYNCIIFETSVDTLLGISTPVKKQKVLCFQFRDEKSQNTINEYLEGGWTIKELQTHHLDDGQHPEGVVVIEKIVRQRS